jgi:hypothetical protein
MEVDPWEDELAKKLAQFETQKRKIDGAFCEPLTSWAIRNGGCLPISS